MELDDSEVGIVVSAISTEEESSAEWQEALSLCLAGSEPARLDEFRAFWKDWFSGGIPGRKITVAAWEGGPPSQGSPVAPAAGAARLWESPYRCHKWFVEGLEVPK